MGTSGDATVIDSDQHLLEGRDVWAEHMDGRHRDRALRIEDDEVGNAWLTWQGERIVLADVTVPGQTVEVGDRLQRALRGEPPEVHYDEALLPAYTKGIATGCPDPGTWNGWSDLIQWS